MLTRAEIINLLTDEKNEEQLFQKTNAVRKKYVGNDVHLRGLIEFSSYCRNNCLYCGLRRGNTLLPRYRLSEDELLETARRGAALGFKTIVLQSGEDMFYTADKMCRIIENIKKLDIALTLSIGERSYKDYKAFRNTGADRYLMRIETTDKKLYQKLDPNMSWQHRYECLLMLKELGYELGSGSLVGLPEQTADSIADDLLFLVKLGVDMAGIGPFIPHPHTPLKNCAGGTLNLALRTMAVMRLLLPDINIPATTAMESLHPEGRIKALKCGANVIMPNLNEGEYRKLYELYPNKACINDTPAHCRSCIGMKIASIGRTVGQDYGSRRHTAPLTES